MKVLEDIEILSAICRAHGKWGLMAYFMLKEFNMEEVSQWQEEIEKATKGLVQQNSDNMHALTQQLVFSPEHATIFMVFDSQEELDDAFFNRIYGDDNSDVHGYDGIFMTIRCLTCDPNGDHWNENS